MALPAVRATAPLPVRASGKRVVEERNGPKPRTALPWQERAMAYYDMIGELHFAASFYAKPLSRLKLGVGYRSQDDGVVEPIESGPPVDLLERVQDPGGGRTVMLSTYGQLMFITGESYMLNTVDPDTDEERWEVVSTDELRKEGDLYMRRRTPGRGEELKAAPDEDYEPVDNEAIVYRLWKRHPRYSGWADSPMRGVLDVAEELVMLTLAVRARARSRLAQSGILYVPNELSPQAVNVAGDEDATADPFLADLTEHFVTPIEDEGTAAAVVPFVVRGPAEIGGVPAKDAFFHIATHEIEETYPEANLRREAVDRMAISLDMPPEALKGMADANHWTAWQVQDDIWQTHLAPIAQQFVDDLTAIFLRPAAREAGLDRWEDLVVTYDAAEILTNPDRGKDATVLYDKRAIGKTALRDAHGFEDEDAPTEEELDEMLAVALRDPSLLPGAEVPEGEGEESPEGTPLIPVTDEEPERNGNDGQASARVLGAAEMALVRCRELAGSRLRSKHRSRPEMRVADGRPNSEVASILGAVTLEAMGCDPTDLVSEGSAAFVGLLKQWGHQDREAEALGVMLEAFAARTLFEDRPPSAPAGFAGFLRRAKVLTTA